ncbi:hypothetical protein C5F52_27895 [Limnohabitans sp. TS-CS-82]|uniref:DUF5666 domain-containing protein n=1 Tax=Limnohabitans sp. TS-CS-82 TaxID=2094193 RepID=UPI000CF2526D|nr:DUF5666 domain-containing protein [Limnohabitans sp. TS-CS-82]PQA79862.1 hypothetical protein C5F52_27895 [Limnohabitans sp. TS-CS-82]
MSHVIFKPKLLAWLMAATGLLSACGGGGTSASITPNTAALSAGTISGLGSIIVNGVRYETVGSQVLDADDDSTAITTPLRIGMTVSVEQNGIDSVTLRPIAGKIWVQSGIQGVASYAGSALTVAGMPITTDTSTILLDTTGALTSLAALNNQAVEVYGLPQADGSFLATLVEVETGATNVQIVGTVQSMDNTAKTLVLGTAAVPITVNYASITPPLGLATGSVIVVKAATSSTANAYTVSSLQIRSGTASTYTSYASNYSGTTRVHNERNELYGAVSEKSLISNGGNVTGCTLKVQGIQVQATSAALCASIINGTYVEAKGTLTNGVLNATKIEFEGSQANGYSDDWNDNDSDGLHHRSLSTLSTPTELQVSRSFEMYGALSCSAVNVGCTLTRGAITYSADMSTARWDEHQAITNGYVEAKGYLTGNTFKVIKIESKDRRYGAGHGDDD